MVFRQYMRMYGRGPYKLLLALGGILTALSVICLFLSGVISINTFAFLTLSSCFTGVMHIEGKTKYSLLTFLAVSFISFLLPVDRISLIYYFGFFGYYPILKGYIEKIRRLSIELILKTVLYLLVSFFGVYLFSFIMGITLSEKLPWQILAIVLTVVFHIYDYALSIFFSFYERKIKNKLRR